MHRHVSLTSLCLVTLVVFIILLVFALYPYYKRSQLFLYTDSVPLDVAERLVKSGDLVLFRDTPTPTLVRVVAYSGSFTHVGLIYRRTPTAAAEIIESNAWLAVLRNNFTTRVQWYQQHQGPVCLRRLNEPLSVQQQEKFDQIVSLLPSVSGHNENHSTITRHPNLPRNNVENYARQFAYCIRKYLFKHPVSLVHTNMLDNMCTDFVAQILVALQILSARQCYACIKPTFFETATLNRYVAENARNFYLNERTFIK